ncbi:MAG: hypothetical protein ABSG88_15585 [Bradyrhizobium sp.]
MTTITGFGVLPPFLSRSSQTPAPEAVPQSLDASGATGADNASTPQSAAVPVPTGFSAAPRLSSDVIGALIASQAQQTAATSGSGATGQATNSSGASATNGQTTTSANSSSGPPTLQQIAGQFDLQSMTYQQEQQLEGELVSSGALTQQDGQHFMGLNTMVDVFNSEHFKLINGNLTATTPSPSGRIDLATQDFPPDNEIQRFQQQLAADPSLGDSTQAAEDQQIVNVLNKLQSIQNGGTA